MVDENGHPVSPSAITALVGLREVGREVAAGRTPVVIHNLITSRAVPDLLTAAGATPVRTRVGHSFIKAEMAEHNAVFGGEHSAHYYFRDFFFADTGMLAAMHVLAALGAARTPAGDPVALSALAEAYEPYVASGEINSRVADVPAARGRVVRSYVTEQGAGPVDGRRARRPHGDPLGDHPALVVQPARLQHRAAAAAQCRGRGRGRHGQGA